MSVFTEVIPIVLGPGKVGLSLAALRYNVANGALISGAQLGGFYEVGGGNYDLTMTFDDANGRVQGVKVYDPTVSPIQVLARSIVTLGDDTAGPGASGVTLIITKEGGAPVADADVWISSDSRGDMVVAGTKQTDSQGGVTFLLDAGATYYLWMQKDGVEPIQGQSFVAVAD